MFHSFLYNKVVLSLTSPNNKNESEMVYNTTATLDKLSCTDYVDFGKCQERFGRFSWTQKWLQIVGYWTKSVQERTQKCRISTETISFNGRSWFQPFYLTKNSASYCSRQLSQRTKFVASSSIYTVQRRRRSNWSLFTRSLTLWIAQTEGFVWHCFDKKRTTQRPLMLKFVYSDGRRRKINFNKVCMPFINLTNLYIFLRSWFRCMIK